MLETKHILILANSIRSGKKCVAGKELIPKKGGGYAIGSWIRMADPNELDGAVSEESTNCRGHGFAKVLDIVKVTFRKRCNDPDHPEDWWFEPSEQWEFVAHGGTGWLRHVADTPPNLWHEGIDDDRVPAGFVRGMGTAAATLYLIKAPAEWSFSYWKENKNGEFKQRRRLSFPYGPHNHEFSVTDPQFTIRYKVFEKMTEQVQTLEVPNPAGAYFCLSLTLEFNGNHYKIGATIFET